MAGDNSMIVSLLPLFIIGIAPAWGNYFLAARTGRSGILYAVLTLIPFIGAMVTIYLFYRAILFAIDRTGSAARS
jgi:uncharacterized membrane protein